MASVGSVTAEVALWPLLHGDVVARALKVERADILLETVKGQPNWRNGPKKPDAPEGGRADFRRCWTRTCRGCSRSRRRPDMIW